MASETSEHGVVRVPDTDGQSEMHLGETSRSRTQSRTRRYVVCWHCGRRGHMRQRCFRRMRQHRKRQML